MIRLYIVILFWAILYCLRVVQTGGLEAEYNEDLELFGSLRADLSQKISDQMPERQAGLLAGMLLGDDSNISFDLKRDLQRTATIHMVVVSGQNLTILSGFLMGLVYIIGRKRTIVITIGVIIFYSILTGLEIPVLRAAIMASAAYFAQFWGKSYNSVYFLFLTAALLLIINPSWLLSLSFQLSFLATFGVVVIAPVLLNGFSKIPLIIRQDLAVTLSAYLMTLPVIVYNFHQLSVLGIFSNMLVLWTIPLVMVSGVVTVIGGLINFWLGKILAIFPAVLLTYFLYVVEFIARLPFAQILIGQTSPFLWIGYYLLLGSTIWTIKIKNTQQLEDVVILSNDQNKA